MAGLGDWLRKVFGGVKLGGGSGREDRIAAYVIREHDRGRSISEIMEDPYVRNRCTPQERERILERPDVLKAIGDDMVEATQQTTG